MDGPNSLIGFNSRGGSDLIGHNKWGDFRFVARPRSTLPWPDPRPRPCRNNTKHFYCERTYEVTLLAAAFAREVRGRIFSASLIQCLCKRIWVASTIKHCWNLGSHKITAYSANHNSEFRRSQCMPSSSAIALAIEAHFSIFHCRFVQSLT